LIANIEFKFYSARHHPTLVKTKRKIAIYISLSGKGYVDIELYKYNGYAVKIIKGTFNRVYHKVVANIPALRQEYIFM